MHIIPESSCISFIAIVTFCGGFISVSYTHLDVYKRQNLSRVSKKYFKNDYMKGLEMTYGSGKYAMDILLSADDNANTADVWNSLTKEQRENTIMEFAKKVPYFNIKILKVPKFELEYSVDSVLQTVRCV